MHLPKLPIHLAPGRTRIGAAKHLAIDRARQEKIRIRRMRRQVPDSPVGCHAW